MMKNIDCKQGSPEWHDARKMRITGSRAAAILGCGKWKNADDVLREMVRQCHGSETEFQGNIATSYGKNHEDMAILCFMRRTGIFVEKCGFYAYGDMLGASPDGLTSDGGIIEVKVPYGKRDGINPLDSIKDQPHYAVQVQMELLCTGRPFAYFVQYVVPTDGVDEAMQVERVDADPDFYSKHEATFAAFLERVKSELNNPAHLAPLRAVKEADDDIEDVISELDKVTERIKTDGVRKAELMQKLIDFAGGKNAEIMGRKLTKAKDGVSVSYADAVKELLPGQDLAKWSKPKVGGWTFSAAKKDK